jgi:hypothetical protein
MMAEIEALHDEWRVGKTSDLQREFTPGADRFLGDRSRCSTRRQRRAPIFVVPD